MCDTMCALQPGRALFAKSSDRPVAEPQLVEAHPARPAAGSLHTTYLELPDAGALSVLGSRPDWMWGFEHGVNERGVAIGNEEIWTIDDATVLPPALTGMDLVRLGLERGRTADEALDVITSLLEHHGQGGIANAADQEAYFSSFLIADGNGAWVLETSARTWAARPVAGGAAISNRVTLGTDWTRSSPDVPPGADFDTWRHPTMWTGHADVRLAATRAAAVDRSAAVSPADLAASLRDHGTGPWGAPGGDPSDVRPPPPGPGFDPGTGEGISVCMHLRGWQATTSAVVAELPVAPDDGRPVRAWVALANPCASLFFPVFPGRAAPTALADPATVARFAALARSVEGEAGPARLAEVRSVLGPLEADLWAEADALVDASDDPARLDAMAAAWPRVDAALTALTV
jgi:secernin